MVAAILLLLIWRVGSLCSELILPFNYVPNGDFQFDRIDSGNYQMSAPGNVTGWTSTISELGKGSAYNSRWGASQVIELATASQNTKYNTTISLSPGTNYQIEAQCAEQNNSKTFQPAESKFYGMISLWLEDTNLFESEINDPTNIYSSIFSDQAGIVY